MFLPTKQQVEDGTYGPGGGSSGGESSGESSGGSSSYKYLTYEDGLDEIVLTNTSFEQTRNISAQQYTLTIKHTIPDTYEGDIFKITYPTYMNDKGLTSGGVTFNISQKNGKFIVPIMTCTVNTTAKRLDYTLTQKEDTTMVMTFNTPYSADDPLSLYTNGFMTILFIGKMKKLVVKDDNSIGNIKCKLLEADNAFYLHRSSVPNFYEIKGYGEDGEFYYADFGYATTGDDFKNLIDGQVFMFEDYSFGLKYTLKKSGNTWVGMNCCNNHVRKWAIFNHAQENVTQTVENYTKAKRRIYLEDNYPNGLALSYNIGWSVNTGIENPLQYMVNEGIIQFHDGSSAAGTYGYEYINNANLTAYQPFNGKKAWWMEIDCVVGAWNDLEGHNFEVSIFIDDVRHFMTFKRARAGAADIYNYNNYRYVTENYIELLPIRVRRQVGATNDSLRLYCHYYTSCIHKISENNYESGTNVFEHLATTGNYNVTPKSNQCTTLFTNYNIQTTGIVMGANLESHFFTINKLGNQMDVAYNRINGMSTDISKLYSTVNSLIPQTSWIDSVSEYAGTAGKVINIAATVASFLFPPPVAGVLKGLSIAATGISNVSKISFIRKQTITPDPYPTTRSARMITADGDGEPVSQSETTDEFIDLTITGIIRSVDTTMEPDDETLYTALAIKQLIDSIKNPVLGDVPSTTPSETTDNYRTKDDLSYGTKGDTLALKSDITTAISGIQHPSVNLDNYRTKDDLSYKATITQTTSTTTELISYRMENARVEASRTLPTGIVIKISYRTSSAGAFNNYIDWKYENYTEETKPPYIVHVMSKTINTSTIKLLIYPTTKTIVIYENGEQATNFKIDSIPLVSTDETVKNIDDTLALKGDLSVYRAKDDLSYGNDGTIALKSDLSVYRAKDDLSYGKDGTIALKSDLSTYRAKDDLSYGKDGTIALKSDIKPLPNLDNYITTDKLTKSLFNIDYSKFRLKDDISYVKYTGENLNIGTVLYEGKYYHTIKPRSRCSMKIRVNGIEYGKDWLSDYNTTGEIWQDDFALWLYRMYFHSDGRIEVRFINGGYDGAMAGNYGEYVAFSNISIVEVKKEGYNVADANDSLVLKSELNDYANKSVLSTYRQFDDLTCYNEGEKQGSIAISTARNFLDELLILDIDKRARIVGKINNTIDYDTTIPKFNRQLSNHIFKASDNKTYSFSVMVVNTVPDILRLIGEDGNRVNYVINDVYFFEEDTLVKTSGLSTYALKTDVTTAISNINIPETNVNLDNYRTKDDLTYGTNGDTLALKSEVRTKNDLTYIETILTTDGPRVTKNDTLALKGDLAVYREKSDLTVGDSGDTLALTSKVVTPETLNETLNNYAIKSEIPTLHLNETLDSMGDISYYTFSNRISFTKRCSLKIEGTINNTVDYSLVFYYDEATQSNVDLTAEVVNGDDTYIFSWKVSCVLTCTLNGTQLPFTKRTMNRINYDTLVLKSYLSNYRTMNDITYGTSGDKLATKSYVDTQIAAQHTTPQSTTITHYAPIEGNINDFIVGNPVFITGKVYKYKNKVWLPSTEYDSIDCICSVKTSGKWSDYIGICVSKDVPNNSITFASHGDYLFNVDNADLYVCGDQILYDGMILRDDTPITSRIQRMTVGIVTSKINSTTLAVFKS